MSTGSRFTDPRIPVRAAQGTSAFFGASSLGPEWSVRGVPERRTMYKKVFAHGGLVFLRTASAVHRIDANAR